nr:MAG TPA: hypothetical protein [Caudoviricetes sp.]
MCFFGGSRPGQRFHISALNQAGGAAIRRQVCIRSPGAHVPAALPPELCGAAAPQACPPGTQCAPALASHLSAKAAAFTSHPLLPFHICST